MTPGLRRSAASRMTAASSRGRAFWEQRSTAERRALLAATVVVALALLWGVGLGPALATLRGAEAQQRALDAQLQAMRDLAAQAGGMQALPRIRGDESRRALEASVRQNLGATAQLALQGERATVTLKSAPAAALAAWLPQARTDARALPLEAHLRLDATRKGWDGTVVLGLPPP